MKTVILSPNRAVGDCLPNRGKYSVAELASEPSLFSCSMEHAEVKGGDIVRDILYRIRHAYRGAIEKAYAAGLYEIIDVRVQRLMPGMFPSIPGWHCDSVPRPNYFAQPDFSLLKPESFHITCIADTEGGNGIGNTVFLDEEIEFKFNEFKPVWQQLHHQIEMVPRRIRPIQSGQFVKFSSLDPHKAIACHTRGWRLFFRMSMYHNPPVTNGVPSQQQVYILSEANGW
jgi:hypothetical protein